MTAEGTSRISESSLTRAAQALSEIARELSKVSNTLAACAERDSAEAKALGASQKALVRLSRRLDNWPDQESEATTEAAHLRKKILRALARGGPALPIELAAATLSLPEEIQPVLETMDREGLIEIRGVRGGRLVTLTARGRMEARD